MIENIPTYIPLIFGVITMATLFTFYWIVKNASDRSIQKKAALLGMILTIWLIIQAVLSLNHIYSLDTELPPKIFLFGVLPNIIVIAFLFLTKKGRHFIDHLSLEKLTYIHIIRIPVEIVLLWLFFQKVIPQIMTFEGWNFDIIMGITAPFIIYYGYIKPVLSRKILLLWNIIGLGLILGIFFIALFSAPSPIQQFAFEQPNIALLYFPYSWLPTFIVPLVVLSHLISIRRLSMNKN